ncbi:MAG TPA: recombinase family protein [Steroidobacteraceae bacterium]|jgi:site-specific DNA recombinase|nr:recombinase family protein [Steroidobacteraceae bacterium]
MKAALYARFSTEKQRDASVDDQFRECERIAKAAGLTVISRFQDAAMSGGTADRPGYQALLKAARKRQFDVIVTEDISRLWRNRAEFGPRSAELEDLGVHCLTCVGDDTRRDGWGLVIQIKQAVAEHARREASYRTRRGQEGVARSGKSAGGRAYGYIPAAQSQTCEIEIDEAQAKIVRQIFELYADGHSPKRIAAKLNEEGIPSPGAMWNRTDTGSHGKRRGKWVASAIHGDTRRGYGILNNERYIGRTVWGRLQWKRSAADSNRRTAIPVSDATQHVVSTDERLRIVPQALWDKAKARQQTARESGIGRRFGEKGRHAGTLLSGLLVCADCGSRFIAGDARCYQCSTRTYGGISACDNVLRVNRVRAEAAITDYLETDLLSPAAIEAAKAGYADEIARQRRALNNVNAINCIDERKAIDAQESQLRGLLKSGALSADVANAAMNALDMKRRKLTKPAKLDTAGAFREFQLQVERYRSAIGNLGKLMSDSDRVLEARTLVQQMLGGQGTVVRAGARVGAMFPAAGLLELAGQNSSKFRRLEFGSGGRI